MTDENMSCKDCFEDEEMNDLFSTFCGVSAGNDSIVATIKRIEGARAGSCAPFNCDGTRCSWGCYRR